MLVVAEVNSKDVDAIKRESKSILDKAAKMKNERIELEVKTLTTSMGGVIISTEDKTRYYNNTLEHACPTHEESCSTPG
jgi:vacuolar-type H+-ATPase subunit E/Vma4